MVISMKHTQKQQHVETSGNLGLSTLFFVFLKIGAISWGGFMALLSVVEDELVKKRKIIEDEVMLDGVAVAAVLPGPMAFNVVAYLGYKINGLKGAFVSMAGILLPSFLLVLLLSYLYFSLQQIPGFTNFFKGILPAVSAIILAVVLNMSKKQIKGLPQILMAVAAGLVLLLSKSIYTTVLLMAAGALLGFLIFRRDVHSATETSLKTATKQQFPWILVVAGLLLFGMVSLLPLVFGPQHRDFLMLQRQISLTFSAMSLSLFGGGYVIIPVIQTIVVDSLHWLTDQEFADAIAIGQITPGPIFISTTFIGFKVGGLIGAINATLSIFIPPALVMIVLSNLIDRIKHSVSVQAVFKGLRPVVIGMIFSAVITLGKSVDLSWPSAFIFLLVFYMAYWRNVNVALLIPLSGLAGLLLFNFMN